MLTVAVVLCLAAAGCTSANNPAAPAASEVDSEPAVASTTPVTDAAPTAAPTPTAEIVLGLPDVEQARDIDLALLGTFVVARPDAGIPRTGADGQTATLEIPVYDSPFGPPRTLLDVNDIDGVSQPISLTNWSANEGVLVLRLIAGGPDDDWLIVQAPTRPNNSYVWVRRNDFDFGFTGMRIEIDLADGGGLTLFDGDAQVLQTEIVHGRDSRPTPTHLTFIERGIRGSSVSPAYGTAILAMASFSDVLGTFGGGGLPSNFLHGTNQPDLMGQRVSSGEIRVPNEILDQIIEVITPGTPVLMFNSGVAVDNKEAILERVVTPAATIGFAEGALAVADITAVTTPQLWHRCEDSQIQALVCRVGLEENTQGRYSYITALPDAGSFNEETGTNVIAVYDTPLGEPRMLVHVTPDRTEYRVPFENPSIFDRPLVLWPLEVTPDNQWIRVQAPIRPQRQSVWVRADDFEFGYTDYRIEIDVSGEGNLAFFDGDTELISNAIVSGRESRPTPLGATYIDWVIEGDVLSPAYGSYVLSMPIFNEALSTFGGVLAKQSIHGTNQPELIGQQVASGHIRLPNEVLTFMAEQPGGLVGASVVTVDSTGVDREWAIEREESRPWMPAKTTEPDDTGVQRAEPGF